MLLSILPEGFATSIGSFLGSLHGGTSGFAALFRLSIGRPPILGGPWHIAIQVPRLPICVIDPQTGTGRVGSESEASLLDHSPVHAEAELVGRIQTV